MGSNVKLSVAISAVLASYSIEIADAVAADDTDNSSALGEIVVTAQRRSENLQDVPISIQALTAETLSQLTVATFDDYVKYLPNVTVASFGPGQGEIYMRGLATGTQGPQGNGITGSFPNVAVYLDEQSSQLPSRNLDIYAADLERIEVLEGPQGTLFGAGAQAGVVRYITNKPNLQNTEGNVTAGYAVTAHGDPSSNVEATLNVPIIQGVLALRGVIYDDTRGGYINNVPSTFTRRDTDLGISYAGGSVPPGSPVINNSSQVGNAINPVTYQGIRVSALWQIDDDWNLLIAQTYQNIDAQGVFYEMPRGSNGQALPDLSVTNFNPSDSRDRFTNTAWTLTGKLGPLKAVYTGGYLDRNVEQTQDYTNYSRGYFADYYQCYGPTATTPAKCYSPSATWNDTERATHQSHELRLSTPDDWRVRAVAGAFWEDFKIYDQANWEYRSLPACTATDNVGCLSNIVPAPNSTVGDPNVRGPDVSYLIDAERGYRQYAFYLSSDVDLIPKVLTATLGTRWYDFNNTEVGAFGGGFGCFEQGPAPCYAGGGSIDAEHLNKTYAGFKSRANLTWKLTQDVMAYYTWSQGYRPGGFNRTMNGPFVPDQNGVKQYYTPAGYAPDQLVNNEIGWKSEWFDHRLLFNGAVYKEKWSNVQFEIFDPADLGSQAFVANGANYQVKGVELQLVARIAQGLTLQGGASWNSSEQTNSPALIANNPQSVNYGKPITTIASPYGEVGSSLAQSPPFQANMRMRYERNIASYLAFAQAGAVHTAHSLSVVGNAPSIAPAGSTSQAFDQPGYTTYDAALGVSKDAWTAQFYGQNITDTRGKVFISDSQAIETETVIRPRVLGVKFGYRF
jgi:iron complex outermembrane receptor protein